jgi:hypothetical protein
MLNFLLFSTLVAFATASSGITELPKPSCIAGSKVCSPQACSINSCSLFKDAVCVSDSCGCRARFFQWIQSEKAYHDVTKACEAGKELKAIEKIIHDAQNDESSDVQDEMTPEMVVKAFKDLNLLTSEALRNIAIYLKTYAESNPTEENLKRFSAAIDGLRSLQKTKRLLDSGIEERLIGGIIKGVTTAFKVGKAIYNAVKNDEIADLPFDTDAMQLDEDEDSGDQGRVLGALVKGISTGMKVAKGIANIVSAVKGQQDEDAGQFSAGTDDQQGSSEVLIMDEHTGKVYAARALPKIPANVKKGAKEFCKGFLNGLCSDPVSADEDVQAHHSPSHLASSIEKDLEIAADLVAADGTFSDIISADPDGRAGKMSTAEKCGLFVGKLTKTALTAAISAGCAAAVG